MTRCIICGSAKNVINHHLSYERDETVSMCRSCHGKVHHNSEHKFYPEDLPPWRDRKVNINYEKVKISVGEKGEGKSKIEEFLKQERLLDDINKHKIRWINNLIGFPENKKLNVSFCERTGGISFIGFSDKEKDLLRSMVVKDVYTDSSGCEDSGYCLSTECEYSEPWNYSYIDKYFSGNVNKKILNNFSELLKEAIDRAIENIDDIFNIKGSLAYEKPPIEVEYID